MPTRDRKKHLFDDCTGFPWREDEGTRQEHLTSDAREVTCGQCRRRILEVIAKKDWSRDVHELSVDENNAIYHAAAAALKAAADE